MRPLDGVLVVSLEQAVAVPYATRLLADLGARVIKVERPGGGDFARHYDSACGPVSSYFAWVNVGKESLELDLKDPADHAVATALIARADVVLCNLSPAATRRLALDATTLRTRHPTLIVGELSSYGPEGPYRDRKAFDALIQSETGLVATTGTGDATARAGISAADIAAGVHLHAAVLAALLHRTRTGHGTTLHLTLMESLAEWMHQPFLYAHGTGTDPIRAGAHHPTIAPYGPFQCRTGAIHLAVQNDGQWRRLCTAIGHPTLADHPDYRTVAARVTARDSLHTHLQPYFTSVDAETALATLDAADVPAALTRPVSELADHPQLIARDRWTTVSVGDEQIPMLRPPVDSDAWTWPGGAVPTPGEHSAAIRAWLEEP